MLCSRKPYLQRWITNDRLFSFLLSRSLPGLPGHFVLATSVMACTYVLLAKFRSLQSAWDFGELQVESMCVQRNILSRYSQMNILLSLLISDNLNEMLGDLFLPCETPEAPKESFFKNLFSGGQRLLDREELCEL